MTIKKKLKTTFKILSIISLTFSIVVAFYIFNLGKTPLTMQEHTLSNGKQTIVFQEMVHIADTEFYTEVNNRLLGYRDQGFKFAYEQVLIKSNEEAKELQELTGLTVDLYGKLGSLLQLDNQSSHMNMILEGDLNADLNASELIRLLKEHKEKNPNEKTEDLDSTLSFVNDLDDLSEYQSNLVKLMLRSILKIAGENSEAFMEEGTYIQKVILQNRDQALFDKVMLANNDKTVIHYGKFHFTGFMEKLKEKDSSWKIEKTEDIVAF